MRLVSDLLTVRTFAPEPPPELRAVFDAERHRRARAYARARTRFDMLASSLQLAVVIAFWFAGGFGWLDRSVRELGRGPILTGLLYLGTLAVGRMLLGLPFAWWSTFAIEDRFGFNRTTPATFAADLAKQTLLALVLGGPLLAAVLWLFETTGGTAWLWGWAVAAAAVVGLQVVAPAWLMPLFMRFTPLAPGALRDAILAYGERVGFPLADVYVVDGSRRSTKANAFFTGIGRHRRIALFDTLLDTLDRDAVLGVVAHEVGHWKLGHVPRGIVLGIAQLGVFFFLLHGILQRPALFAAFGVDQPSPWTAIALFGLLLAPVELALSVVLHAWSRRNERQADRFAVETTGDGPALARGLARLAGDSLANPTPHPLTVWLDYSHPPVRERIRALDPQHAARRADAEPAPQ